MGSAFSVSDGYVTFQILCCAGEGCDVSKRRKDARARAGELMAAQRRAEAAASGSGSRGRRSGVVVLVIGLLVGVKLASKPAQPAVTAAGGLPGRRGRRRQGVRGHLQRQELMPALLDRRLPVRPERP